MANARERADWPESHGKPLSDANPQPRTHDGGQPATVAYSGPHGVVQAILDVTPRTSGGQVLLSEYLDGSYISSNWGDPAPVAARQAAAVLRWLAADVEQSRAYLVDAFVRGTVDYIRALADEVEANAEQGQD